MKEVFNYIATAKDSRTIAQKARNDGLERISVWTDGLSICSEYEPRWSPAFRFELGKRYRIVIQEVDA